MNILKTAMGALLVMAFTAASAIAHDYKLGDLQLHHPHTRAMIPGAKVGGGFVTVINHGKETDRLISASSPSAAEVQIHEMKMEGDVMKMAQLPNGIEIAPGATVELKPGGLHLMFMHVAEPFQEGATVKATLVFEKAGSIELEFKVGPANNAKMNNDHAAGQNHDGNASNGQTHDPAKAIATVLKAQFETEGKMLDVNPVSIQGDWAIAGWSQDGKGGRALMRKGDHGWAVHLCSGSSLKDAATLEKIGIAGDVAKALADANSQAEAAMGADKIALFDSFEGTIMMNEHGQ